MDTRGAWNVLRPRYLKKRSGDEWMKNWGEQILQSDEPDGRQVCNQPGRSQEIQGTMAKTDGQIF